MEGVIQVQTLSTLFDFLCSVFLSPVRVEESSGLSLPFINKYQKNGNIPKNVLNLVLDMPERRLKPANAPDACRVHGSLTLNKVAGNFHVTAGKVLPIAGAHAHMTGFMDRADYNFSHRIEKLSFGENHAGIIQPLEGDEKLTDISKKSNQSPTVP